MSSRCHFKRLIEEFTLDNGVPQEHHCQLLRALKKCRHVWGDANPGGKLPGFLTEASTAAAYAGVVELLAISGHFLASFFFSIERSSDAVLLHSDRAISKVQNHIVNNKEAG